MAEVGILHEAQESTEGEGGGTGPQRTEMREFESLSDDDAPFARHLL